VLTGLLSKLACSAPRFPSGSPLHHINLLTLMRVVTGFVFTCPCWGKGIASSVEKAVKAEQEAAHEKLAQVEKHYPSPKTPAPSADWKTFFCVGSKQSSSQVGPMKNASATSFHSASSSSSLFSEEDYLCLVESAWCYNYWVASNTTISLSSSSPSFCCCTSLDLLC
jgi:hypothetical protein